MKSIMPSMPKEKTCICGHPFYTIKGIDCHLQRTVWQFLCSSTDCKCGCKTPIEEPIGEGIIKDEVVWMAKRNYEEWTKDELICEVEALKKQKTYGLIWEKDKTVEIFDYYLNWDGIRNKEIFKDAQIKAFEKGKQAERERIDDILLKLKENMELAGYKEGWDNPFTKTTPYRQGQFSVFEWLKREVRR